MTVMRKGIACFANQCFFRECTGYRNPDIVSFAQQCQPGIMNSLQQKNLFAQRGAILQCMSVASAVACRSFSIVKSALRAAFNMTASLRVSSSTAAGNSLTAIAGINTAPC